MEMPPPKLPSYDIAEWKELPFPERMKLACQSWAEDGYGTPFASYVIYMLKIFFYIWMWSFFVSFTPGLGGLSSIDTWWTAPQAFQKAILWSLLFEILGLGCGSGPLTGRYSPPLGGVLYFLRPGTTKMPFVAGLPIFGGKKRTLLDVALYALHLALLVRALTATQLGVEHFVPIIALLLLLGLTDKTLFLASRGEHFWTALVCLAFVGDWIAGSKVVWLGIWMWAATSKINLHFPSVVCVMTSNSPTSAFGPLRKWMYKDFPNDLRPSKLAQVMAHMGTLTEFSFPILLVLGDGGTLTTVGLTIMLLFHIFITSNIPMGVPLEWNFVMVYGAFFLFGHHAGVPITEIGSPLLIAFLFCAMFLMPLIGNLFPSAVSFLCSMRYYAGNWAYSVWLFKGDSSKRLSECMKTSCSLPTDQLLRFFDDDVVTAINSKIPAFRAMHLHGRALHDLLPKAVNNIDDYEYFDGEIIAGFALGWNFGDGHLHNMQMLESVQEQCGFEEGELRCIFVESQPLGRSSLAWKIADAKTGLMEEGKTKVRPLLDRQPWPTPN